MSWLLLATSHGEWLGLTGIGSSESELESAEEDVAVGANVRGDDMFFKIGRFSRCPNKQTVRVWKRI